MDRNWSRVFRYWVATIILIGGIVFIWVVRDLITPMIIAALLAFALTPIVDLLDYRTPLSHKWAANIVFITGLGLLIALPATMLPVLVGEVEMFFVDLSTMLEEFQAFILRPIVVLGFEYKPDIFLPDLTRLLSEQITNLPSNAFHILEATTKNLLWALVIVVATFYFLRDWPRLRDWLFSFVPEPYDEDARRIYREIRQVWQSYLRGNLALMFIVGTVFSLVWTILGVPGALLLGVIAGILTIIPDVGPAIAVGVAVIVALFEGSNYFALSNFWFAMIVAGCYLGLINVINIWVRPHIFGRSVHVHDGVVFIAIMGAILLLGILGALVIVPILASAGVVGRYIYYRVVGLPPWPEAKVPAPAPAAKKRPQPTPEPVEDTLEKEIA